MKPLAILAALIALAGVAWADEARDVPALGAKLTYRFVSTTTAPSGSHTAGEVYTYIVTKSEGDTAEGIIRPVALIIHCKDGGAAPGCKEPAEAPGAHFDGDLLTVPIAADSAEALAKQSGFKFVHFIRAMRKFPVPGPRQKDGTLADIGPEPKMVLTDKIDCNLAALDKFLPVGAATQVTVPCDTSFELAEMRNGRLSDHTLTSKISVEINYTGDGLATLPSGNWEVKKLAFKTTPADQGPRSSEGENLFSPQLGIIVQTRTVIHNTATKSTTESSFELIAVEP